MAPAHEHVRFQHLPSASRQSSESLSDNDAEETFSLLSASDADLAEEYDNIHTNTMGSKDHDAAERAEGRDSLDSQASGELALLAERAEEAAALEHRLTPREAIRAYPMAVFWSLMVSMCVIMEGYDTIL